MKKMLAVASGAVFAAVSCVMFYQPIAVHADAGELAGAVDYFMGLDSAAVSALNPAGFAVAGAVFAIDQALKHPIEGHDALLADSLAVYSGVYYTGSSSNRVANLGTITVVSGDINISDGDSLPFLAGADYDVCIKLVSSFTAVRSSVTPNGNDYIVSVQGLGTSGGYQITNYVDGDTALTYTAYYQPALLYNAIGSGASALKWSMQDMAMYGYESGTYGRLDLLSNARQITLPAGDVYANYYPTLREWVATNYPEYVFLFPEPTPTPIYPTGETVAGMPREWTVENPPLPTSPQLDIDIPNATLPDLSGLSQYTDGVGFWWALTGQILDTFGIRNIVLLLIGIAVLGFAIYRLGA